jgi:hypothetical protein
MVKILKKIKTFEYAELIVEYSDNMTTNIMFVADNGKVNVAHKSTRLYQVLNDYGKEGWQLTVSEDIEHSTATLYVLMREVI